MKTFLVTEEVINEILAILGELPAKTVIRAIDHLRGLKEFCDNANNTKKSSEGVKSSA